MYAIIACQKDIASMNILEKILEKYNFKQIMKAFDGNPIYQLDDIKIYIISELHIESNLPNQIEENELIFISKHKAESEKPTLTVHPIGNWGLADFGGKKNTLCSNNPSLMKKLLIELKKIKDERKLNEYEVSLETTHHGPLINSEKNALFIELGSSEKYWYDMVAAEAIADTVMNVLMKKSEDEFINTVCIGGGHYSHEFTKIDLKTDYAVGHMCPKYALPYLNEKILRDALEKSKAQTIIVNTKGLGDLKEKVIKLLDENNLEYLKLNKLEIG